MGERTDRFVALATTIAALAAVVAVEDRTEQVQAVPDFGPALADPERAPDRAAGTPLPAGNEGHRHAPLRVLVRATGLDAPVLPVGATRQGDMSVPSDPAVAGWYLHGPALPPAVFRRDGPPVLTLITCAPPYVPGEGGHRANLVVVAEPVPA